jgi:glyoxylase-like metal-dependent hydrolase (beta-lactamase superfamily II)
MTPTGRSSVGAGLPLHPERRQEVAIVSETTRTRAVLKQLTDHIYHFADTCNVYVLRSGTDAVLIDFGAGDVLDALDEIGVERVTDVLMTHHHRDQAQGLNRAVEAGIRVWVPAPEHALFSDVEAHWLGRQVWSKYNVREEDRFSLARSVPVAGPLEEYVPRRFGPFTITTIPLPGHTAGSVGFLVDVDDRVAAFTGDLIAGPGKVWSLAGTQWSYAGSEGLAASVLSLLDLKDRGPDVLFPSHGIVMWEPAPAIDRLVEQLLALLDLRGEHGDLIERRTTPFNQVLPHLLHNHASYANSYVLLSESGKALVIDQGYDFDITNPKTDPSARRPWLYTLPALKERFGVEQVEVVIPTHYHDDHVAGFNLLRAVEGTEVWAADIIAPVLENPTSHDLPCLWYDPIEVDQVLLRNEPIVWQEYELLLHHLPGHTLHAVAIEVVVDGTRVLFTGDQHDDDGRPNYIYQNRFRVEDYRLTGELLQDIAPQILLTGHWGPIHCDSALLEQLRDRGTEVERLHRQLLFLHEADFDAEGFGAWIRPYQSTVRATEPVDLEVEVRNPNPLPEEVRVNLRVPAGWQVEPATAAVKLAPAAHGFLDFEVTPPEGTRVRRAVITADLAVGRRRFGEHAAALVTVR